MRYDLALLNEFCREIGLATRFDDPQLLEVLLGDGAALCFVNAEAEQDCLLGFADTPWHTHNDLVFNDSRGHYVELDSLDLLNGLKAGSVLLCELHHKDVLVDRWLIHSQYNDDFRNLQPGEQIIIKRAEIMKLDRGASLSGRHQ